MTGRNQRPISRLKPLLCKIVLMVHLLRYWMSGYYWRFSLWAESSNRVHFYAYFLVDLVLDLHTGWPNKFWSKIYKCRHERQRISWKVQILLQFDEFFFLILNRFWLKLVGTPWKWKPTECVHCNVASSGVILRSACLVSYDKHVWHVGFSLLRITYEMECDAISCPLA